MTDKELRKQRREARDARELAMKQALMPIPYPIDKYDVVVMDPPWPMKKILREVSPLQNEFDYPTMSIEEIRAFPIPDILADNSHFFLWTTQKYLPAGIQLLEDWGLDYILTMVWHKPGGFQPFGLPQYNCEFVLYTHQGNPKFVDTKKFPTCFCAPRGKHSEKPGEFYDMISRVCTGSKIDIFARKKREEWITWGWPEPE